MSSLIIERQAARILGKYSGPFAFYDESLYKERLFIRKGTERAFENPKDFVILSLHTGAVFTKKELKEMGLSEKSAITPITVKIKE